VDKLHERCIPLSGSLELTHRCNLACRHCYQYPPAGGEMSTRKWISIMDELADAGCLFLAFTGGEPLVREDILKLLYAAAERNFVVTLQTNATLFTGEIIKTIGDLPGLRVDASIYGARPSTHDALTGVEGSYEATLRSLRLLKERGVPLMLKVVVGNFNLDEVEGIAALANELEAPVMFTSLIFPRNDRDPAPIAMRLDDAGLERFMLFEIDFLPRYLSEVLDTEVKDVADYVRRCAIGPQDPEGGRRYCGGGRTVFAINPYGDVYPCVAFPLVLGNLLKENFTSVWSDSQELKDLRREEAELPQQCHECPYLEKCGICRALSFLEKGETVAVSEEKCRLTHALMKVLENA
jgi:radical SAM protein with 4Fe4S-binding SPASM domain